MSIPLVFKELRETAWMAAIALLVNLCTLGVAISDPPFHLLGERYVPGLVFSGSCHIESFLCIGAALAVAIGLWQTVGESARGTFPFLLHRPAGATKLIGTKLAVGAGWCLLVTALPLLLYGWWAATPANHPSPFSWSMMTPVWQAWPTVAVVYLAAFTAGLRPGRWYGTRLLPLVAASCLFLVSVFLSYCRGADFPVALPVILPVVLAVALPIILPVVLFGSLLVASVLFVAETRDYS